MPESIEKLLETFIHGNVQDKYKILRKLIALRQHHAAAKEKQFLSGIDNLLAITADTSAPELDRLLAVATLGRLASTIKKLRPAINESLSSALREILPDPLLLDEPDDRSYIASACERIQPEWGVAYCSNAAVFEETGEQARVAFLKALLVMNADLASTLDELATTVLDFVPTTEDPGTSTARRLKRIMISLQAALAETMIEPGEEPGKQLALVCRAAFKGVADAKNETTLLETAEAVAAVIHEMVRLRFSLAIEAVTYSSLKVIKAMLPVRVWEKFAAESQFLQMVVQDITEAMLILAKQGISDEALAGELAIACGHKRYANQKMKQLANTPGLPSNIKNWLAGGKNEIPAESATGETRQLSQDSQLADLLVDSLRFQALENVTRGQILPEIEMLDPRLSEGISRLVQSGVAICDAIQGMARRRKLQVRGRPGDEEEYAPMEHEVVGDNTGIRKVRIIRPVVEQVRENGVSFVISKGVVEKIT